MLIRTALISILIVPCSACDQKTLSTQEAGTSISTDASIAVFEEFVPKIKFDPKQVHCLEIDGENPEAEVISVMTASGHMVAPFSECTFDINHQGFHNKTNRPAVFHFIRGFTQFGDTSAEVDFGSVVHGLDGMFYRVDLQLKDGKWLVSGKQPTGVS